MNEGLAAGLGFGTMMLIVFCSYALAVWYGAKMILEKGYTGGDVVNVIFAVLTGSMYMISFFLLSFLNLKSQISTK